VPKSKKGLGRGFESLIPTELLDESFDVTASQDDKVSDLRLIKISEIHPDPEQPRQHFDDEGLSELADSIREHGIIQPLVVTPDAKSGYMIVAGERRYRASLLAKLDKLPVIVRTLSDQHKLELAIIENVQRRGLTAIEVATSYAKLRDQFNLTMEQIGERVGGKSTSAISNTMRLLKLPYSAKEALADGQLTEGQARPLIGVETEVVDELVPQIIAEKWSARQVEHAVSALRKGKAGRRTKISVKPVEKAVLDQLEKRVGTKVKVATGAKGSGSITLKFKSLDERQRLLDLLNSK